jgi:hypothetical protein
MEHSCIRLNDLPDEILLIILKKLHNCDVLYSLIDVNKRLDTIVNDLTFTRTLTLITPVDKRFDTIVNNSIFTRNFILITHSHGLSYQFIDTILDRFCFKILPKINDKIERLNLEFSSMERILLATNYPNLHALGIYDLPPDTAHGLFSGKIFSFTLSMINCIKIIFPKILCNQSLIITRILLL